MGSPGIFYFDNPLLYVTILFASIELSLLKITSEFDEFELKSPRVEFTSKLVSHFSLMSQDS